MASKSNLVSLRDRPPEERRRIASLGGKRSAKRKAEKRKAREVAREVLGSCPPKLLVEEFEGYIGGLEPEEVTLWALVVASMVREAVAGSVSATRLLAEFAADDEVAGIEEGEDVLSASLRQLAESL